MHRKGLREEANDFARRLATVNFFLAMVGIVQLTRIGLYESSKKSAGEAVADVKEEVKHNVEAVKKEIKN